MNKSQMILAAIGGVVVVGALALGYLIWDASSAKSESAEALEGSRAAAASVMRKLPLKPEKKELEIYRNSCKDYADWRAKAEGLASAGDLVFEATTPAVFKTTIVAEARKIADLPGCFDGKLVKPDFHFGFKDYIVGGALPPDDPAGLRRLQREWNDVSSVLRTLASCGAPSVGIVDVKMGARKQAKADEDSEEAQPKKKGKKGKKAKARAEDEPVAEGPAVTAFTVEFLARPAALVKAINAFATGPRFVVVEDCTFARERDALAETLGGDAQKSEQQAASSGRRRRRAQQVEERKEEVRSGLVTDPAAAPLLKVSMGFSVYDFGSLERAQAEAKSEEGGEGEEGGSK